MIARLTIAYLILLYSLIGCTNNEEKEVCGKCEEYISNEKLASLKEKALKGDLDSAEKVMKFYVLWGDNNNKEETTRWTELAAELGSVTAQYNLGTMLFYSPGDHCEKSIYWLKKSASSGSDSASSFLESKAFKRNCYKYLNEK